MGLAYGIASAAATLGFGAIRVRPKRGIGAFTAHVPFSERPVDELDNTDPPVEQGAQLSDHSYKRPAEVVIECAWSNSPVRSDILSGLAGAVTGTVAGAAALFTGSSQDEVRDIYRRLLELQASRQRFDVFTGKRAYSDMLLKSLVVETDKETENVLRVTAVCRQVLIATVRLVQVSAPAEDQADPQSTLPSVDKGVQQLSGAARGFNMSAAVQSLTPSGLDFVTGARP